MKTFCLIFIVALAGCSSGPPCSKQVENFNWVKQNGGNFVELGAAAGECEVCFKEEQNSKEWRKWKNLNAQYTHKWFHQ
jgi:hypothetical protein